MGAILYTSRSRKPDLETELGVEYREQADLLAESDFVTMHCALTPDTTEMCNAEFFAKMKPTAVFVNTGRGGLVQQDDLYEALRSGNIYAAGLDVTTPEPLPTDHPLFTLPNCIIAPHIGSASIHTRETMATLAVENLQKALLTT